MMPNSTSTADIMQAKTCRRMERLGQGHQAFSAAGAAAFCSLWRTVTGAWSARMRPAAVSG
jgi:hypothetical protein